MKWFKHVSKSRYDAKIMRLIRKHGLRGYGLYFAILEGISFDLEPDKPVPELEETAHDIASFFYEDTQKVEEIVSDCVKEGLFTINPQNQRIMCLKLLAYLDNTLSQNPQIKEILSNFKSLEAYNLKQIRLDEIRSDKIRLDNKQIHDKKRFIKPTIEEVKAYATEISFNALIQQPLSFIDYYEAKGWRVGSTTMKDWRAAVRTWQRNEKKYAKDTRRFEQVDTTPPLRRVPSSEKTREIMSAQKVEFADAADIDAALKLTGVRK